MLCPACAAMERSDAKAGRAGVRTIRRMALVAAVLAVVLIVLVSLSVVFSRKYDPVQFTDQLTQALAASDTKALTGLVAGKDIAVSEENLAALCRAFSTEEARAALTQQLEAQIIDPTLTGSAYPALSVEEDRVFLGYSEYRLAVQSVQLMPVSYTHLDVYKRQFLISGAAASMLDMQEDVASLKKLNNS